MTPTNRLREAFEAWFVGMYGRLGRVDAPGAYADSHTHTAWDAWQSATLVERERCAKVCDGLEYDAEAWEFNHDEGSKCAAAIRAGSQDKPSG